jgi:hypothetical protein
MNKNFLQSLAKDYKELIPTEVETGLLITALKRQVESGMMEEAFTQNDFNDTLFIVQQALVREQGFQNEIISKKLSKNFYTTVKVNGEYRYKLTQYAKSFSLMLEEKVQLKLTKISLLKTLRNTIALREEDLQSIEDLEAWYDLRFTGRPQQTILAHIEHLQAQVDEEINSLKSILKDDADDPVVMIKNYLDIFVRMGEQAEELSDTLLYKEEILKQLNQAIVEFSGNEEVWNKYKAIANEVEFFFEGIDRFLQVIEDKIQESVKKLRSLLDNVRYKQLYKLRLEKFLNYLLVEGQTNKEESQLPSGLNAPVIIQDSMQFKYLPDINYNLGDPEAVPEIVIDEEYLKEQEEKAIKRLEVQEKMAQWTDKIWNSINEVEIADFQNIIKEIYQQEQNWEIPLEVASEIVKKTGFSTKVKIEIKTGEAEETENEMAVWKMNIKHLNS